MSDIPVISITQEEGSDEECEDIAKLNIAEAHTDTEDLIMEQDTVRYCKSVKTANALVDTIKPTLNGSVTDVEDCSDSEDEDDGEVRSAKEADITLESFLDQGYVDETTKSAAGKGDRPKTLTRCTSKATETDTLQVCLDAQVAALTDCEDCDLSDDDDSLGKVSIPDCPEDVLMRETDNDAVDIHNSVKRKQEKHTFRQEAAERSSSESDNEAPVRHRRCHRKPDERVKSDCEDFSFSDEETAGACAPKLPNRQSALFEAEELLLEGSDVEDEGTRTFPEINISFVSDEQSIPAANKISTASRPSALSVQGANADEALTDVENLNSSDSEDEQQITGKRLMPRAVIQRDRTSGNGGTTDVEDFDSENDDHDEQDQRRREVPQEFLPSPVREIAVTKLDGSGEQHQNVMPLNQALLSVKLPDEDQALTDVEDMSDNEETSELYDSSKYAIESLPEVEHGDIYSSDNQRVNSKNLEVKSPAQEPLTDTEDLFFERSASTSGTGSELRRRRKPKQSHAHAGCQSFRVKKLLESKSEPTAATTDVEDIYLSEDGKEPHCADRTKQRRATIQFSNLKAATAATNDAKTDIEFLSGDELLNECTPSMPQLSCDGFSSVVKARERHGNGQRPETNELCQPSRVPLIRRVSPSPDAQNCATDSEDIQMGSDGDEYGRADTEHDVSYSRAQTATPYELTRALEESGSCEIYDSSTRCKRELLDVKGMTGGDQSDNHTDVEFLEDDAGNQ